MGDDDQNIYAFNRSSVEFIRRFEADYDAKPTFLLDNYRSTGHIIAAANAMIEPARHRMKTGQTITINRTRSKESKGGPWSRHDPLAQGKVQILPAGETPITQALVAVAELQRLGERVPDWDWSTCAVVARNWKYLDPVRNLCELRGIPVEMANEDFTGFWHLRETWALRKWLTNGNQQSIKPSEVNDWVNKRPPSPWNLLLQEATAAYKLETGGRETSPDTFLEWLAEWGRDFRREQHGLLLTTAHRAKGLEFDHVIVLDGAWERISRAEDQDAPRRLYYVAMTRARQTLTLMRLPGPHPLQNALQGSQALLSREASITHPTLRPELHRRYRRLSLREVFLSYAGYKTPGHPVHQAIASLSPGDPLRIRTRPNRWEILNLNGTIVGKLASGFKAPTGMRCQHAAVLAIATWDRERSDPRYQDRLRSKSWEVVIPELVFEPLK